MDHFRLSASAISAFHSKFQASETQQEHLQRCWHHQTCQGCLGSSQCSWCPFTWSCVPNSWKIPLLAPAYDQQVCPHKAERWEVRTQPFGCQVSSITSLTAIVSIVSTITAALLIFLVVIGVRWLRKLAKNNPGWWRSAKHRWKSMLILNRNGEEEPLLAEQRGSHQD